MPLTDTAVRQAKPKDKDYSLTDSDGLALFVAAKGTKAWHFRFSWHGKQPRISLGTYPEISLRDARDLRDQARTLVAKGLDPRLERRKAQIEAGQRVENTFEAVANRWHNFKALRLTNAKKGSKEQSRRYLDKDLIPSLGRLPIDQVTRADVLKTVRKIEARGALHVAEKCRGWLNEIFRYGIAEGVIEVNPASDIDIVAAIQPPVEHNPILRMHELGEFLRKLKASQISVFTKSAIRLMLLTMVRTIEARSASPGQFDLEDAIWRVPPEGVKQLQSRVRTESGEVPPYLVPLSRQAVGVVREVLSMTGRCKLVFTGRNDPSKMMSENTVNMAIKRMGYEGKLTGHGLRGTVSTALNEMGYNADWIEAQLSHAGENKVRGSYNHAEYVEQRRGMMQDWADYLDWLEAGHPWDKWIRPTGALPPGPGGDSGTPLPAPGSTPEPRT
uniref:tyrosine-type recombinase/integrase n=1 Tax=Pseudomonas bambusae TaxID=3139142 RepID=UPI004038EE4D